MNVPVWYLAALVVVLMQVESAYPGPQTDTTDDGAKEWLERMIEATQTLNYEGDFFYVRGNHLESMHIIHKGGADGQRQRMVALSGAPREVIVSENHVISLLLNQQAVSAGAGYQRSPFPISLPQELDELEANYWFKMLGSDRVAGKKTQVIAIEPRDEWRFGYRLWLEQETGMVLRSALLDKEKRPLEQLMFTHVEFKPDIDDELLSPSVAIDQDKVLSRAKPAKEKITGSEWRIAKLPAGFEQVMHSRFKGNGAAHATEHMVLTDGLATVSVFLEPLQGDKPLLKGDAQLGAIHAFGKVIEGHQALVIGEVPQQTVEMIAASLKHASESAAND